MSDLPDIDVAIDLGTTTVAVCWRWTSPEEMPRLLKFRSPGSLTAQKDSLELPATFARSQHQWHFGPDATVYSDTVTFSNVKMGISGRPPYREQLQETLRKADQEYGVKETPVTLLTSMFRYIQDSLKEQVLVEPNSKKFLMQREFENIAKRCWVTYPVKQNDSLRISLVEAALAAGFDEVHGISESLAAVHFAVLEKQVPLSTPSTVLLIDCGGGSSDAATVIVDEKRQIKLACVTDGLSVGGQTVNETARAWLSNNSQLTYIKDDLQWEMVSVIFDGCKMAFNGIDPVTLKLIPKFIKLEQNEMQSFYDPLISNVLDLFQTQYKHAEGNGCPPNHFILCGGPARNSWFFETIKNEICSRYPSMICERIFEVGAVAQGALLYAQNPLTEPHIARAAIGLEYLDDHHPSGRKIKSGKVQYGIGWVIEQGHASTEEVPCVEFLKTIYRQDKGPGSRYISTRVFATTERFDQTKIRPNNCIQWSCPITYPAEDVLPELEYLGKAVARIPHNKLFLKESDRVVEARFLCTIKPLGQLLELVFFLVLGSERLKLEKIFLPAANWINESELKWEQGGAIPDPLPHRQVQRSQKGRKRKRRQSIWDVPDEPEATSTEQALKPSNKSSSICSSSESQPFPQADTPALTSASHPQLATVDSGSSNHQNPNQGSFSIPLDVSRPEPDRLHLGDRFDTIASLPVPPVVLRRGGDQMSISSICERYDDDNNTRPERIFSLCHKGNTRILDIDETEKDNECAVVLGNRSGSIQDSPDFEFNLSEAAPVKRKPKCASCQELGHTFMHCPKSSD
ncbi:hypothetical protein BDV33DRAFT_183599 [Aspergillus novoparasiticus]|uniref:Actin-like ATPase domain-containing protein n=1 Tax=Aspergillus novoparasiticus TaxID=986946 RepID=A0A5N6E9L8_9EURO|nr:hypothetical protein BDV33DRAFT_183599 [Aspergillus novoparasiticus]